MTGGAGFIGSTLADRLLAEGWDVDVVDDLSTGSLGEPGRRPVARDPEVLVPPPRRPFARDHRPHRAPQARRRVPPRGAGGRAGVGRPSRSFDAEVNIIGTLNVCQGALRGRHPEGRVRGVGRHALRHPRAPPGAGRAPPAPRVAVRRGEEGVVRLPALLPGDPRARVLGARVRQRLRTASGPARRGRASSRSSRG